MKSFDNIEFKGKFRNYQQRVLDNADKYLLNKKINIVAAPGSGKTILGLELINRLKSSAIIFSPTTTIKYQWGDRFEKWYLPDSENVQDYVSYDLHKVKLINSVTYQALHSAINKLQVEDDEEITDYSDIDIFALMKKNNVKTICLDEAHHLQNEWQKALETFISTLGKDVQIIALTATPPYDATKQEWDRYEKICGEIDEEILVPELVKEGTLCPHQDFVYLNYPDESERQLFVDYKQNVDNAIQEIQKLDFYSDIYNRIESLYNTDNSLLYEYQSGFLAVLKILQNTIEEINPKIIRAVSSGKILEQCTLTDYENAYAFLIDNQEFLQESEREQIKSILKKYSLFEKGKIVLSLKENLKRKLVSSVGKLKSIAQIAKSENQNLGKDLRMLVLTDYIKKETIKDVFGDKPPTNISIVSIFESIVKQNPNLSVGAISGNLVILPIECKNYFGNQKFEIEKIKNTNFAEFKFSGLKNIDKVNIVAKLFEQGKINVLIGTKSLLGEGWDSPCINSLVLASFVGSFMLSNQMRGRAIRIDSKNPNKVSNIWHLVTLEPEYLFKTQNLSQENIQVDSYDLSTLKRRFNCFVGPNYKTWQIESGIDRIEYLKGPFTKQSVEYANQKTLEQAKQRSVDKEIWDYELKTGYNVVRTNSIPKEKVIKPFVYQNASLFLSAALVQFVFIAVLIAAFLNFNNMQEGTGYLLIFLSSFLTIIFAFIATRQGIILIVRKSPKNNMKHLASALLKTLKECEKISYKATLKVESEDEKISIYLTKATTKEQNLFNEAIKEMLSPIENPRYLIIFKNDKKLNYSQSYACPSILGQNKNIIEVFSDNLEGRIGDFKIVYTRNEKGKKYVEKCKEKSFINKNDKIINNKTRVIHN